MNMRLSDAVWVNKNTFLLVSVLLQTPHSIASIFTFMDREYLSAYKARLFSFCLFMLAIFVLAWVLSPGSLMLAIISYNFYHYSSQQAGVTALLAHNKSRTHEVWKWASSLILMAGLFGAAIMTGPEQITVGPYQNAFYAIGIIFFTGFIGISILLASQSKTRIGKAYIAANTVMLITYFGFYLCNLWFYMLIIPIFVHAMTAFLFYINHNSNRNARRNINLVSRIRNVIPVPEYILTPLVSILCAAIFIPLAAESVYSVYMAGLASVVHFYLEAIMWKKGTPHREHLHF
ncbi:MAG: hypothetical protein PSX71_06350 [bacterium]|nr:hypothetical protein [bacterium]